MPTLSTIMEECLVDQELKKICDIKNLTFYMTKIPDPITDPNFISLLKLYNVSSIIRIKENSLNWMSSVAGILMVSVNFTDPIPDEFMLRFFWSSVKKYISEGVPTNIVIEESVRGVYILGYVLIELGMSWKNALKEMKRTGLELEKKQEIYLIYNYYELKRIQKKSCSII